MSGYVLALPVNVNDVVNKKMVFSIQNKPINLEIKPFWHNQDDVDIKDKDLREDVAPIRKLNEQRLRLEN